MGDRESLMESLRGLERKMQKEAKAGTAVTFIKHNSWYFSRDDREAMRAALRLADQLAPGEPQAILDALGISEEVQVAVQPLSALKGFLWNPKTSKLLGVFMAKLKEGASRDFSLVAVAGPKTAVLITTKGIDSRTSSVVGTITLEEPEMRIQYTNWENIQKKGEK